MAGPYRKEFADARLGVYISFDLVMIRGELFDLASGKQLDIADSIAAVRKAVCLLCASHLWYLLSNQICAEYVFVPGRKPDTAGLTGIYDPGGGIFLLLRPRREKPETARTAGRSERAGAFTTPALSACFFFVLRPLAEKAPQTGANLPDWGRWSTPTHRRAHRASQRPTRGRYQVPSIHPICIPVKSSFSCS